MVRRKQSFESNLRRRRDLLLVLVSSLAAGAAIGAVIKGILALKVGIPFVFVTAKPHATVVGTSSSTDAKSISNYFSGNVMWRITGQEGEPIDLQKPLEFGKIDRPVEKLGIANINFTFEHTVIDIHFNM